MGAPGREPLSVVGGTELQITLREHAMPACLTRTGRNEFERLLDMLAARVPQWAALDEL
ncbi:hypothetical protein ACKWRH_08815 [Bradyrhizobium sp. Pa8]|uniref:hypothetical protein n=1 Tax=Bradyrhizobium sp. Pa8 TaxID=3386552 RepID=UPI00403F24A8